MDINYLKVRDEVKKGIIDVEYISTSDMVADPMTKAFICRSFQEAYL